MKDVKGAMHNILKPVLEQPFEKESKTTMDSKNLV